MKQLFIYLVGLLAFALVGYFWYIGQPMLIVLSPILALFAVWVIVFFVLWVYYYIKG